MVTRTIKSTLVVALCVDTEIAEITNQEFVISGTFPDDEKGKKKLLNKVKEIAENDTTKVVEIVSKEETEKLYGVTEQEFLTFAKEVKR